MNQLDEQANLPRLAESSTAPPPSPPDTRRRRARRALLPQDEVPHNATSRTTPERADRALELARLCARVVDDNRGKEILLLDLRQVTALVDFFVIATASSRRQSHAMADEIDQLMKRQGERKLGLEGSEEGRWVLIDYGDFVVHIFSPEARTYYALEEIWGDAVRLEWQDPVSARPGLGVSPSADV
jgi:ribosome-associated protein